MNTRFKKANRDNFTVLTHNLCVPSKTQDDDDIIKYDLLLSHMERLLLRIFLRIDCIYFTILSFSIDLCT